MYTIAIDLPNLPEGSALEIDGLGEFQNGQTFDISDELADTYQARKAVLVSEYDEEGHLHNSLEAGPTLMEAFADHPFIKVTAKSGTVPPKVVAPVVTPPVAPVVTPPADPSMSS